MQAIDPPWQYEARAADMTHRARNPYPDMTLDAIKALPVGEKAHPQGSLSVYRTICFPFLFETQKIRASRTRTIAVIQVTARCVESW